MVNVKQEKKGKEGTKKGVRKKKIKEPNRTENMKKYKQVAYNFLLGSYSIHTILIKPF